MSHSSDAPGSSLGPEPGPLARVMGVFFSPSKTFESIARKPGWDWLVPVLLIMVASFISQRAMLPKMDVEDAVKTQMRMMDKMSQGNMSAEQRAEIEKKTREGMEAGKTPLRSALNTLFVPVIVLLVALIYHGLAAAFSAKTSYFKVLSGYAYTWVIYTIPLLLSALVALPRETLDASDIQFQRVLKSNVAAFLDFDTTNKALLALLSSVDIFDIWGFFIGSIALSKTTRFSPTASKLVVGGVWGAYIVIKVIFGLLYSAFMG